MSPLARTMPPTVRVQVFYEALRQRRIVLPVAEYRFDPARRWRMDFAWPVHKVALEVEGGVWTRGRHTRGSGYLKDCEKYNRAAVLGWRLLRCTPTSLCELATVQSIADALADPAS